MKKPTQRERVVMLQIALRAAYAYLDLCPCDPDIFPDQWAAWQIHEVARQQITEAELI